MKRILLFTGDGKGKTTAALGVVLRATGHGQKCLVIQFVKRDGETGEAGAGRVLSGVEIVQMGRGFVPNPKHPHFKEHCQAASDAMAFAEQAIGAGSYDLIVLDEVCIAVDKKLIEEDRVLELLKKETMASCIILTGRRASQGLIEAADTVTEMRCVKHALQQGNPAQRGVEY
jgi:cob(I)alamin adenosyltransferase